MKYIIEIEDEPFVRLSALFGEDGEEGLYRAKGFNSLVFDKNGLDKLIPLNKELDEAYQKGYEVGSHEATTLEYQQGLDDAWNAARKIVTWPDRSLVNSDTFDLDPGENIFTKYSASRAIEKLKAYEEQQKADEIKVGDIITDGKINYLVIDITDKSYIALQGTDFEPSYIGKDYIKSYHNLHDSKDMRKMAEEINKAMKEGAE